MLWRYDLKNGRNHEFLKGYFFSRISWSTKDGCGKERGRDTPIQTAKYASRETDRNRCTKNDTRRGTDASREEDGQTRIDAPREKDGQTGTDTSKETDAQTRPFTLRQRQMQREREGGGGVGGVDALRETEWDRCTERDGWTEKDSWTERGNETERLTNGDR